MEQQAHSMTIGALAAAADVSVETVRFYQRRGLLSQPLRTGGSVRRYGQAALQQLKFIKSAQRLGFSLQEIAEVLPADSTTTCAKVRKVATTRLAQVRERLADMHRVEHTLAALVASCHPDSGSGSCPIVAALQAPGGLQAGG